MGNISQLAYDELKNKEYFDRWSMSYDDGRISRWFQYTQELAIGMLDLKPNSKVLDVGCGTGYAVFHLASLLPGGKAYGIDISEGMIRKAWAKATCPLNALQEKVEFCQASSEQIPYPTDDFDCVLCTNSFHHYPNPLRALGEMHRVLKPGGKVVILDNAPDLSWYTWVWDHVLRIIETGHVRYYASEELGGLLHQAGFINLKLGHSKSNFLKHGKIFASIQIWGGYAPLVS